MWHQVLLAAGRIYFPDQVFTPDPLHWECEVLASLNCISYFSVSEGYIAHSLFSVFSCFLPHLSSQAFSSTVFGELLLLEFYSCSPWSVTEGLRSQCESVEFISPSVLHPSASISGHVLTLSIPILPILLFLIFKNFY